MRRQPLFFRTIDGTTSVEFALIALPFILLIAGAVQLFVLLLSQQMLETAAEAVGRQILTGKVQQAGLNKTQFGALACSLLSTNLSCDHLIVDVQVASSFTNVQTSKPDLTAIGNPTTTTVLNYSPGTAGQIVVVRLLYALPVVFLPGFNLQSSSSSYGFNFPMATSVFKNESYS